MPALVQAALILVGITIAARTIPRLSRGLGERRLSWPRATAVAGTQNARLRSVLHVQQGPSLFMEET
jgi:hypothetical protein